MRLPEFTKAEQRAILEGAYAITSQKGQDPLDAKDERTLDCLQRFILRSEIDLDQLQPVISDELQSLCADPRKKEYAELIFPCLPFIDEIPKPSKVAIYKEVKDKAGLDCENDKAIKAFIDHRYTQLKMDLFRRTFQERFHINFLKGIFIALKAFVVEDRETADSYKAMQELGEETFGRQLARFYIDNRFLFPGEKGGYPKLLAHSHDARHVLFGFDTSLPGEWGVGCCEAAACDPPYQSFLIASMMYANTGFDLTPEAPPALGTFDPDIVFGSLERGSRVDPRIMDPHIDFLPYAKWPLEKVRAEFKVPPGGNCQVGQAWCGPEGPPEIRDMELHQAKILEDSKDDLVAFCISGKLSTDDIETFMNFFRVTMERHDKVNVLVMLERFSGWDSMGSFFKDLVEFWKSIGKIERLAILGDQTWQKWMVAIDRPFAMLVGIDERYFDISEYDRALHFCKTGD